MKTYILDDAQRSRRTVRQIATKTDIAAMCLLCLVFLCGGCDNSQPVQQKTPFEQQTNFMCGSKIVIIDSCEYITFRSYGSYYGITHKGNCKYCRARAEKHLAERTLLAVRWLCNGGKL